MKYLTLVGLLSVGCVTMSPVRYQVIETAYLGDEFRVHFGPTVTCESKGLVLIERLVAACSKECSRRIVALNVEDGRDARQDGVNSLKLGRTVRACRRVE